MKKQGIGIVASFALVFLLFFGMEHMFLAHAAPTRSVGVIRAVRVTSGGFCPKDVRLPAWTQSPTAIQTAFADGKSAYAGTEFIGPDLKAEYTWEQGRWTFEIGGALGSGPAVVEESFVGVRLPGAGVLSWQVRKGTWDTTAAWRMGGSCYHFRTDAAPGQAPELIGVLRAWLVDPVPRTLCRIRGRHAICRPET